MTWTCAHGKWRNWEFEHTADTLRICRSCGMMERRSFEHPLIIPSLASFKAMIRRMQKEEEKYLAKMVLLKNEHARALQWLNKLGEEEVTT